MGRSVTAADESEDPGDTSHARDRYSRAQAGLLTIRNPRLDARYLLSLIRALAGRRVVVVGDAVADAFVYGRVMRVSREAPVLILEHDSTDIVPGGAGNAANNVAALGGRVTLVTVIGRDETGRRLVAALHPRVSRGRLLRTAARPTPVKTRILAGDVHSAKQQIVRIDHAVDPWPDSQIRSTFARRALDAILGADAVIVSDYGLGLITPKLVARMRKAFEDARLRVPLLIDTRHKLLNYRGLTACTPNESEVEQALGVQIDDNRRALERSGRALLSRTQMEAVLITRGSRGMALFVRGVPTVHIPIFGSDEIVDVTGAGDTVMASVALALAAGASFEAAARLANYAGGLVVMKRGTATVTAEELFRAVHNDARVAGAT